MRIRRRLTNFALSCGLSALHGSKAQRMIRTVLDEVDLEGLRRKHPCPGFADRFELYRHVHDTFIKGEPVDYLEFGVYRGESIAHWVKLNSNPASRFFGFDSFEGLPEDWRAGQGKGHFDVGGNFPRINDSRVQWVKGWFENTVPPFVREFKAANRLVLHLDADLYSSTMIPLMQFSPYFQKGTLLIFDEFYDREHEFKALMDWQRIYKREFKIVAEMGNYGRICAEIL